MMNGPPISSNRDNISRSMSTENWREAKSAMEEDGEAVRRGGGAERGGGGLGGGSRGWGNTVFRFTSRFVEFLIGWGRCANWISSTSSEIV